MKNVTLSVNEKLLERAREKLRATGKTVNQEFREHLKHVAGDDGDLERELEEFVRLSGKAIQKDGNGIVRTHMRVAYVELPRRFCKLIRSLDRLIQMAESGQEARRCEIGQENRIHSIKRARIPADLSGHQCSFLC